MKSALASKSSLFSLSNVYLKKKSVHLKKVTKYISKLKVTLNKNQDLKRLNLLSENKLIFHCLHSLFFLLRSDDRPNSQDLIHSLPFSIKLLSVETNQLLLDGENFRFFIMMSDSKKIGVGYVS